jgi:RNA polymerase sigma-70 factor (ECF subfamily)
MVVNVSEADAQLRQLVEPHRPALQRYALRLANGDYGRAEDIVQESLVRAWRNPQALNSERGSLRAWLFTVAHRISIDAHRARQSRPPETDDRALAELASQPVSDPFDASLDRLVITEALRALSKEHRDVIVETYLRGRTVSEAALVLGIPAGTVKSRSYYALRALKLALNERGVTT